MNEAQVKHFIVMERQKGTTIEELIFILHDNGVPEYEPYHDRGSHAPHPE